VTDSNGANGGRDRGGRFTAGNAGGPGNPRLKALAAHQAAIAEALTPEQVAEVVRALHARAVAGDVLAARALLERIAGRPADAPVLVRVGDVQAEQLRHHDDVGDLAAAILAATARGDVDVKDAERFMVLAERLGAARDGGWARQPDRLLRAMREHDELLGGS
jgi:hypothetical protein